MPALDNHIRRWYNAHQGCSGHWWGHSDRRHRDKVMVARVVGRLKWWRGCWGLLRRHGMVRSLRVEIGGGRWGL